MTSFLWGTISDRIGRKVRQSSMIQQAATVWLLTCVYAVCALQPVLMVGNISAALSILALGVAPNYSVAIMSRFIGGLFTSSTGV